MRQSRIGLFWSQEMVSVFVKWLLAVVTATALLPFLVTACTETIVARVPMWVPAITGVCIVFFGVMLYLTLVKHAPKFVAFLQPLCEAQSQFVFGLNPRYLWLAIFLSAGLSLYLELSIIRWQASVFEFFSFYKNFGLLACFAGLGIGYVLSARRELPLVCCIPLLVMQQVVLLGLRYFPYFDCSASLQALPVLEQLNMGMTTDGSMAGAVALYYTLTTMVLLTMLALVPVGQLCGQLMSRMQPVKSYGANLLGSLFGIALMTLCSMLYMPPASWFALIFASLVLWSLHNRRSATIAVVASLIGLMTLSWNFSSGWERVFSPYQLLERGPGDHGWSMVRAAGLYYQRVMDLSPASRLQHQELEQFGRYYDLPYSYHAAPDSMIVFGSGMGNDVAAALRNGAQHVTAVEIDPCIAYWGKLYHPEAPYNNPRVKLVVNDARAYLRGSDEKYDMIVFGLLDSHSLSGHASSLRIDSYVYTLESLKEARSHLKPGGMLAMSFSSPAPSLTRKLHHMMALAFDGHPPVVIGTLDYDNGISFLQNKEGTLVPQPLTGTKFTDFTQMLAKERPNAECSTDDWPFFYMPQRCWPLSYLPMLALLVGLTFALNRSLVGKTTAGTAGKNAQFFLLGAGFMLIEAKAITELGLSFGNTWQITGTVIAAVLTLGFVGNLLVQFKRIANPLLAYALVLLMLAAGWWIASNGGFPPTFTGKLSTIAVLIGPVVFSGIAFSLLIDTEKDVSAAMCWNLLGAMLGGILEYCAMATGYRALYVLAVGIYGSALVCYLLMKPKAAEIAATAPVPQTE
jgi:spermidine synthase